MIYHDITPMTWCLIIGLTVPQNCTCLQIYLEPMIYPSLGDWTELFRIVLVVWCRLSPFCWFTPIQILLHSQLNLHNSCQKWFCRLLCIFWNPYAVLYCPYDPYCLQLALHFMVTSAGSVIIVVYKDLLVGGL